MLAVFKTWVVLALLFYNIGAFANQCVTVFASSKTSLMTLASSFDANPRLELYPKSASIQTPTIEFKIMVKRLEFYKNRVNQQLSKNEVVEWFKPIQEDYINFISNKIADLESKVQNLSKNKKITLYDYTALIIRVTYIGQSIESIIFTISNSNKKQALFEATRALTNYESLAFETTMAEMRNLDKMINRRIEEILNEQLRVYKDSGFRLRPILTLITPSIKTINRLSARGYSVISVPKTYVKADGIYLSVINYLNHDLTHLSLRAGFYIHAAPNFLIELRNRESFAAKKRNKYLKKINKFNQQIFNLSEKLSPLESHLLESIYFYIVHERGLPPEKKYIKSFFKIKSSIGIANEIYNALVTREWGYDPIIDTSQNLKFDILLSIAKIKKLL